MRTFSILRRKDVSDSSGKLVTHNTRANLVVLVRSIGQSRDCAPFCPTLTESCITKDLRKIRHMGLPQTRTPLSLKPTCKNQRVVGLLGMEVESLEIVQGKDYLGQGSISDRDKSDERVPVLISGNLGSTCIFVESAQSIGHWLIG